MSLNIANEIAALERLTVKQLQARYAEAFGETAAVHNKAWLVKRIAWRLQALAEGDLSQRARQRAALLANDADLRLLPPKRLAAGPSTTLTVSESADSAPVPIPSTDQPSPSCAIITRIYKGQTLHVKVLTRGFELGGNVYPSLSAVAKAITGQHCSGIAFFRMRKETSR